MADWRRLEGKGGHGFWGGLGMELGHRAVYQYRKRHMVSCHWDLEAWGMESSTCVWLEKCMGEGFRGYIDSFSI